MKLQDKIDQDWKVALKNRDEKKNVLSLMKTELKNKAIANRSGEGHKTDLQDEESLIVLAKMAKQRRESMESYRTGGRDDLAQKEQAELVVIESYLPKQMSESEIEKVVKEVISSLKVSSPAETGKVMGVLMGKLKGKADGRTVQSAVKKLLS